MSHIFISYSSKDIDFAGKIVQALAEGNPENKLDTWIDWKSIPKVKTGSRKFIATLKRQMPSCPDQPGFGCIGALQQGGCARGQER